MTGYRIKGARRAFTLVELLIVLAVLGVVGMVGSLSLSAMSHQTARREAERAMHWLYGVLLRADQSGKKFSLSVKGKTALVVDWEDASEQLEASRGCSFKRQERQGSNLGTGKLFVTYSPAWGTFTSALTVQVQGPGEDVFFLILSGQGKVRISPSSQLDTEETMGTTF